MNRTLHDLLDECANDVDTPHVDVDVLVARGELRLRRRRLAAVVGTVVAVVLAMVIPTLVLDPGTEDARPANSPRPSNTPTSGVAPVYDPPAFPAQVGRYHLVSSQLGKPGQTSITLTVQKPSGRFTILPACSGPRGELDTKLVVNGTSAGGITCLPDQLPEYVGWPIQDLTGNGVDLTAKTLAISLTLVRGRFDQVPTNDPGAVLGLAVYQRDHHQ